METLQSLVKSGPITRAQKHVIYGPNGIGKTTLTSGFPAPIFVDTEDGTTHQNLKRIQASTEEIFFEALRVLVSEEHAYKTLVIDTIAVAERFNKERVLKRHRMKNIEDFGYGRGWTYLREEFDAFLGGCLDATFIRRGMHVVAIGHSAVKRVQPPAWLTPTIATSSSSIRLTALNFGNGPTLFSLLAGTYGSPRTPRDVSVASAVRIGSSTRRTRRLTMPKTA